MRARPTTAGWRSARVIAANAMRARWTSTRVLQPVIATYHVTSYCNLNCVYCEDFGRRRNRGMRDAMLDGDRAKRVLRVLRTGVENLILSGGEALLHPRIEELVAYAEELRFANRGLITNGLLLPRRERVLRHVTRLVISLDSLDTVRWDAILDAGPGKAASIIRNVERYGALQDEYGYQLVVNCVVMPDTVPMARRVMEFCTERGIAFSFSPQGVRDHPHAELIDNEDYRQLVRDVMQLKDAGHRVLGSRIYLEHMLDFDEFQCYPTVNVRIHPNGDLVYPCRPIAERGNGEGGVGANVLAHETLQDAFDEAAARFPPPPDGCRSCFQQCFAEPSLLTQNPGRAVGELLHYHGLGS